MPQSFSMLLGNLTIATKLRLMAAISTLVLIALSGYLLAEEYQINRVARQTAVRQTVEIGHSILEWAHKLETSGSHTREEMQIVSMRNSNTHINSRALRALSPCLSLFPCCWVT